MRQANEKYLPVLQTEKKNRAQIVAGNDNWSDQYRIKRRNQMNENNLRKEVKEFKGSRRHVKNKYPTQ